MQQYNDEWIKNVANGHSRSRRQVRTKRILRDGDGGQQRNGPCIGEGGKSIALNDNDDLAIAL